MKRMILSLISLLFATGLGMAQEVSTAVVSTKSGKVSGIIQEGTMAYLGIPYAKVERFMPPQPVKKWSGIRKCDPTGTTGVAQQGHATRCATDEFRRNHPKHVLHARAALEEVGDVEGVGARGVAAVVGRTARTTLRLSGRGRRTTIGGDRVGASV